MHHQHRAQRRAARPGGEVGRRSLSIGLESVSQENLEEIDKGFNKAPRFEEDLAKIRAKGIQVIALMMVGLDGDDTTSFDKTLDFLVENKLTLPEAVHALPVSGHEVLRRHGEGGPHPDQGVEPLRLRLAADAADAT